MAIGDELRRGTQFLPCRLSNLEIQEKHEELVKLTQERVDREINLDHWKADKKEEQKALEGEVSAIAGKIARLAKVIRDKEEDREVEVVFYIKDATVRAIRQDNFETISERPATPGELQMTLPDGSPEKKDD